MPQPKPHTPGGGEPSSDALVIAAGGQALSLEQERFNEALAKLRTMKAQRALVEQALEGALRALHGLRHELAPKRNAALKAVALLLGERMRGKGLTARQRHTAEELLAIMLGEPSLLGDQECQQLGAELLSTDPHPDTADLPDEQGVIEDELGNPAFLAMLKRAGLSPNDFPPQTPLSEVLTAAQIRLSRAADERQTAKQNAKDERARKKKAGAAAGAGDAIAPQALSAPDQALRDLYRQLARDLHPDREPDALLRERKTELMSRVNAANDRKDLLAMLELQSQFVLEGGMAVPANLPDARVAALTQLLDAQIKAERQQLDQLRSQVYQEFGLALNVTRVDRLFEQALESERAQMARSIAVIEGVQDEMLTDRGFKAWLKREAAAMDDADFEY